MPVAKQTKVVFFACTAVCFSLFSMAVFTPAMPLIAGDLNSSNHLIQSSINYYLIAYGGSQLIYGPLSDAYGRKPILILATTVVLAGNIITILSTNGYWFIGGHILAGLGAGSGSSVTRALIRDVHSDPTKLTTAFSSFALTATLSSAIAPFIGAIIQSLFGWRAIFGFLILIAITLIFVYKKYLPETLAKKATLHPKRICSAYLQLFKNRLFIGNSFMSAILFGYMVGFLTVSPFLLQKKLGYTIAENGNLSLLLAISMIVGIFLLTKYHQRVYYSNFAIASMLVLALGTLILLLPGFMGLLNVYIIMLPGMCAYLAMGLYSSFTLSKGLGAVSQNAGAAGGLQGTIKILGAGLIGLLAANLPTTTQIPLGMLYLGLGICLIAIYFFLVHTPRQHDNSNIQDISNEC